MGRGLVREVLDRVDRLAVAPDEQAHVVAVQDRTDTAVLLDHLNLSVELQCLADEPEPEPEPDPALVATLSRGRAADAGPSAAGVDPRCSQRSMIDIGGPS